MPVVKMPDGQLVDMPDNPTPQQQAALRAILSKGATAPAAPAKEEPSSLGEAARVVGKSIYGGLTSLPRFVTQAGDWLEERMPTPDWTKTPIPGYEQIAAVDKSIRQAVEPETKAGKVVGNIGEAAVGALASPGGLAAPVKSAIIGASSGAGSEAAAAAFGDNAVTRVLGGVAGGLAGGLATAAKTNREALAREALADVDPAALQRAVVRQQIARDAGIHGNISQFMDQPSNLDAYVEALANSKHGRTITKQLRKQPQQIAFGIEDQLANLPGQIRMPQVLANNAQEAAEASIRQGMDQATKAWQKFAPQGAAIPEGVVANFDAQLKAMAAKYPNTAQADLINDVRSALKTGQQTTGGSPLLDAAGNLINPPTKGPAYLTDALQVKGAIDDVLQNFGARKLNTPGLQGKELRRAQEVRSMFRDMIDLEVPQLAQANKAYEAVMSGVVDPLKKSVVGRVAGRVGANAAQEAPQARLFSVFEKGTVPGATSSEILTMEKAFRNAGQPEVFQDAAKSWLAGKVSSALKSTDNRMPENIGERLRVAFGDPRQLDQTSKGFEDVLAGLARSQGVPEAEYIKGFKNFMEIVSDVARRPGSVRGVTPGEVKEMASEGVFKRLGQVSVMTPIRQPALKWASFLEADALSTMDKLLTTPEGVATLVKLGKQPPKSHAAVTTMATFLGTNAAVQGGEQNLPGITAE